MSVVSEANAQEPWESEDVLWQEELPTAEGDPTAEESWARWAGGGDYAPGDGGGRWRHPLDLPMRMLRLAGLWRPRDIVWKKGERPRDVLYHVYAVIAAMLFVIFTGTAAINIKYSMDDMGRLTDVLSLVTVGVFNGAKVTAMFFRRRRVERCLYLLRASLRLGPPLESRSKTIQNFERRLTIIANGMGWTAVITCAIWMTAPWLGKLMSLGKQREPEVEFHSTTMAAFTVEPTTEPPPPRLPFDLWFPLDLRDNLNYALGIITQFFGLIYADAYSVLPDIFWIGMLYGGCVSLRMLRASLRELSPESQPSPDAYLAKCIRQHQAVLTFVREISEVLGPILLVGSLNLMVLIACVVFHASSLGFGNVKILSSILFLGYEMTEFLFYSYFASELMWECEQVANDVYYSQWFRCSPGTRKSVYFVMLRASTPSVVNVSGFTVLGLDLFSALVRASYSVLAVLQQANDN